MTKCSIKNIVIVAVFGVFLFPVSAHADFMGELAGCTGADVISLSGFLYLFVQIAQWILGITGSLALLMFVIGGFVWLISGGSKKMVDMGKATLTNALFGMAIVFGSWMLIGFIMQTIAPNVGGWSSGKYTFNGSLCESARTTTLGRKEEAPLAPPVTQVQTRADEIKENASEDITTECIPKAQAEERCKNAETKIGKPPGNIAKVELVNKDSAGAACPTDTARCVVIDKEGLKCDSLYGKPSMKAIGCACGSDNISTAVKGDSPASPKKTTIDGVEVSYFCCQCAPNTSLSNPDCGQNMNSESDFGKQSYKCCEQQSSNLKLCRNGTKMFTDSGECYCVIGENGSVCSPSSGEGCRKGLECKLVSELYNQEQCEECKGKSGWDWAWCVKNCASARILGGAEAKWKGFMSDTFKVTALGQCACPSGTSDCLRDLGGH